jgi:hypothetical protein
MTRTAASIKIPGRKTLGAGQPCTGPAGDTIFVLCPFAFRVMDPAIAFAIDKNLLKM